VVLGLGGRVDQVRPLWELVRYDGFEVEEVVGLAGWQEGEVVRLLGGGAVGVVGGFSGGGVSGSGGGVVSLTLSSGKISGLETLSSEGGPPIGTQISGTQLSGGITGTGASTQTLSPLSSTSNVAPSLQRKENWKQVIYFCVVILKYLWLAIRFFMPHVALPFILSGIIVLYISINIIRWLLGYGYGYFGFWVWFPPIVIYLMHLGLMRHIIYQGVNNDIQKYLNIVAHGVMIFGIVYILVVIGIIILNNIETILEIIFLILKIIILLCLISGAFENPWLWLLVLLFLIWM